jgi:hypothetical protein
LKVRYLGTALSPWDVGGISLTIYIDVLSVDDQFSTFSVDITLKTSVSGVIFEHVDPDISIRYRLRLHVFKIDERIVDGLDDDVFIT